MEDYCHAVEHSIEFQVVFLQHLFGPSIRVVPVLCGSLARSLYTGGLPEEEDGVRRTVGALGEIAAPEGNRLLWVLGVDMAHMGQRYGDACQARADRDDMEEVALPHPARNERKWRGDARRSWERGLEIPGGLSRGGFRAA